MYSDSPDPYVLRGGRGETTSDTDEDSDMFSCVFEGKSNVHLTEILLEITPGLHEG